MSREFTQHVPHDRVWSAVRACASRLQPVASRLERATDSSLQLIAAGTSDPVELVIGRIMLDAGQRAERRCPYSAGEAIRGLLVLLRKIASLSKGEQLAALHEIRRDRQTEAERALASSRVPTSDELKRVLARFVPDPVARDVIKEIIAQGGLDGKYTLDVGNPNVRSPVIESTLGYNFSLLSPLAEGWSRSDARVLVVDGMVDFVHELHHAFEKASGRFPLVVVARRFGDEVIHTARVNQSRGTLDVLFVAVPMEIENLNTLKDISIVCGTELVSSLKGQSIASVDVEAIVPVKEVTYRPGLLTIVNPRTARAVESHRTSLAQLRDGADAGVARFYEQRIKSLSPNHTLVKLPASYDALAVESFADRVGSGLRLVRAVHEAGVCSDAFGVDATLRKVTASGYAVAQAALLSSIDSIVLDESITPP